MCSIEGFTGPQPFTIEDYTKFNKDRCTHANHEKTRNRSVPLVDFHANFVN